MMNISVHVFQGMYSFFTLGHNSRKGIWGSRTFMSSYGNKRLSWCLLSEVAILNLLSMCKSHGWFTSSDTALGYTLPFGQSVSSVAQSCPTLCDPMDCSMPGFTVHHRLSELAQTHLHQIGDAIKTSHPLSSPFPPVFNLSQHQGLFQWVSSSHQVVLEFQLQHQSFQWTFRTDFLEDWLVWSPPCMIQFLTFYLSFIYFSAK